MSQETQPQQSSNLQLVQQLLKEADLSLSKETFRHASEIFSGSEARKVILYYLALAVENKLHLTFLPENMQKAVLQDAYQRGRMDLASELLNLKAILETQPNDGKE